MSSPNQLPAYFRYLKARLQPFGRPAFLVFAFGIFLLPLFVWEYWVKPFRALEENPLSQFDTPDPEPTLASQELAALSADIDSSAVLRDEFDRTQALTSTTLLDESSKDSKPKNSLDSLTRAAESNLQQSSTLLAPQNTSEQKPSASNPFAKSVQDFLNLSSVTAGNLFPNLNSDSTASSSTEPTTTQPTGGSNLSNLLNINPGTASTSALENALNRINSTPATSTNNPTQTPVNSSNQTLPNFTTNGQGITSPTTLPRTTNYGVGQVNYPPTSIPGGSGYNGAGQRNYAPTVPGGSGYNGAGQPTYIPAPAPVPVGNNGYQVTPISPAIPSNIGQYPNQTINPNNGVVNPGVNPNPITPGLQPSQLNRSNLNR
ncbi:MAG TPA: hypothetical protein DCL61_08325 [Cyanobacteria bacterium UBA12227]|nr:hypothetical protein [Cyanobacteria bacterium UBA12227]HAX86866.1 hypothetical protein [Cyanobacteria bacterium UBA11370]HBY79312.1 hypothetical protein [Cyanobacteria bacterium UBA11148]